MSDFSSLPVHAQNALRRAGITSAEQARAMGRDALAKVPGLGPLAVARLFSSAEPPQRHHTLSTQDLQRVRRWFEALDEADPARLDDADRALAKTLRTWLG